MPRAIEHVHSERQVVAGESPGTEDVEILGADAMPVCWDGAGVRELTHFHIGSAVAEHLDALGTGGRVAGAVHHNVCAEAADDIAHPRDASLGGPELLDIDRRLSAELARQLQRGLSGAPTQITRPAPIS